MTEVYAQLAAPFDVHHKDPRGLDYLTGNQVVGRLNEVLGPAHWTFSVKEHGYDPESDEIWVLGRLTAHIETPELFGDVCREQFGSQKHNRRKTQNNLNGPGAILDYGFDLKGAATDALKKCATLIGVGLYLSEKDGGIPQDDAPRPPVARQAAKLVPVAAWPSVPMREQEVDDLPRCVECNKPILANDASPITADQARIIRDRFGSLVCREHRQPAGAAR